MIIIDSVSPVEHGHGSVRSIYTLYADTMDEVPLTGAETKPLISGLEDDLPPTTLLYTGDYQIAVLDTYDHWRWKSESEDDTNVFYVYHSGRPAASAIETVHITSYIEEHGYDLTRNRTKGTYYGGYALESGVTPSDDAYDGSNWTWTTMETASGTAITPTAGVTYYVKELPSAYLRAKILVFTTGTRITDFRPLSDLPDTNGSDLGWIFNDTDAIAYYGFYQSVTWVGITHTVESEFGEYGAKPGGWLFSAKSTTIAPYLKAGTTLKVVPKLITDDGVTVVSRSGFVMFWGELISGTFWGHALPDPEEVEEVT